MTSAQVYALFINPVLILAILGTFAAVLMRQSKRDATRILEAERVTAASAPGMHGAHDAELSRKHSPAE